MDIGSRCHCCWKSPGRLFGSFVVESRLNDLQASKDSQACRRFKSTSHFAKFNVKFSRSSWSRQLNNKADGGNCLNRIIRGRFTLSWKKRKLGTSFWGKKKKKFSGNKKVFPSSCKKVDGKQMGKLCVVLITFSPSSGPSISTRNRVHWVKLSLISSSPPRRGKPSKLKAFPAVPSLMKDAITRKTQN